MHTKSRLEGMSVKCRNGCVIFQENMLISDAPGDGNAYEPLKPAEDVVNL